MLSIKLDTTKHFEVVNEIQGLGMLKKLFMKINGNGFFTLCHFGL